jgi:hypothetical protein
MEETINDDHATPFLIPLKCSECGNYIIDVKLVQATDCQGEDHDLVLVGSAKYILNYHPQSVISTTLSDFNIKNTLSLSSLKENIK